MVDYSTPEYVILDSITPKKWETCRGLGYSFGFNRLEDNKQVIASKDLVRLFVDIVSKNGNLLLNVGPKEDGSIPQIQLDRLTDLGNWMKINSEGIYDSKPWKIHSHKNANGLDVRFTKKGNNLYVFIFNLPKNNTVFIPDLVGAKNSEAIAFGDVNQKLKMVKSNNAVEIKLPENVKPSFCTMLKITNITE
jgi:alpha-L-fucosidase